MNMHDPPHPGAFTSGIYLEPNNVSGRELAQALGVSASTLSRVLNGSSRVRPWSQPGKLVGHAGRA